MATENKAEKPIEETGKSSKISPPFKSSEANTLSPKDGTPSDATSCISSGDATSGTKEGEVDQEMLTNEPCLYYPVGWYGHYYPGSFAEWDDQGYPIGNDGLDLQQAGFPADNSSVLYYAPGLQPEYSTYSPFFPGAVVSPGQYLGQQAYYASPVFPQPVLSPGYFSPSLAYGHGIMPGYWDASYSHGDGNSVIGDSTVPPSKGSLPQVYSPASIKASSKPLNTYEAKKTAPARALSPSSAVNGQSKSMTKVASVLSKSYFPVTKYPSYSNEMKSSILYPCDDLNVKGNGQNWVGDDKPRAQSKAGVGGIDLLDEQNRGPRTNGPKTAWLKGSEPCEDFNPSDIDSNPNSSDIVVARDDYNLAEFPSKYEHALFFVIKSYSEDDIHKSIKYNVWASTPSGNQRLDNAFKVAREKMEEKGSKCPVFLFFSVNASGQFCGVAEMIARVDFSKNMDFWQQDKWSGFFPVKWHIIKDVPNAHFRHIILENNDNKPVTNSRDTQEVKFPQGTEVLNIFKSFSSKTSILDDFSFYENRQKAMQKKRVKPKLDDATQVKKTDDAKSLSSAFRALNVSLSDKRQVDELQVRFNAE